MDSFCVRRVDGESVDSVGWVGDETAAEEDGGGLCEELFVDLLTLVRHDC